MYIYPDLMADPQEQGFLSLLLSFNSIAEIAKERRETGLQKLGNYSVVIQMMTEGDYHDIASSMDRRAQRGLSDLQIGSNSRVYRLS